MALQPILVLLDALTLSAAIAVLLQALKAHKALKRRASFAFAACFAFIATGILLRLITDSLTATNADASLILNNLAGLLLWQQMGLLLSAFCLLAGYMILLLIVEDEESIPIWIIISSLVLFTVFLARNLFLITHVLAIILLGLLAWRFFHNWKKRKNTSSLLVFAAFSTLVLAHTIALLIAASEYFHVAYLALRLIGFFLLFWMTWRVGHP